MIKEDITIIIPSLNQIEDLIKTIDFINTQYKSKICRVLVADYGSIDGSTQYISQKSWESRGVEFDVISVPNEKRIEEVIKIDTKYFMIVFPGFYARSRDFLVDNYNILSSKKKPMVLLNEKKNKRSVIPYILRKNKKIYSDFIFSSVECLSQIISIGSGEIVLKYSKSFIFLKRSVISY